MKQTLDDLKDLADSLGSRYLKNGKVDLEGIIEEEKIRLIYGHYGQGFLGHLVHENGNFYIHVNMAVLTNKNPGRIRYTIAHELGHYFNDDHRTKLMNGESLSYTPYNACSSNPEEEKAANHFAAFLLMPQEEFSATASLYEMGLPAILGLKNHFETSIESTANHYSRQNLAACMIIKWKSDLKFDRAFCSNAFSTLTGIKGRPSIKITKDYIEKCLRQVNIVGADFFETATQLSKWVGTISPRSKNDITGLEQTMKLGNYGALTILLFTN